MHWGGQHGDKLAKIIESYSQTGKDEGGDAVGLTAKILCIVRETFCLYFKGTRFATEFPCPRGYFNPDPMAQSLDSCLPCPPGHYCGKENLTAASGKCDAGEFWICFAAALGGSALRRLLHTSCKFIGITVCIISWKMMP